MNGCLYHGFTPSSTVLKHSPKHQPLSPHSTWPLLTHSCPLIPPESSNVDHVTRTWVTQRLYSHMVYVGVIASAFSQIGSWKKTIILLTLWPGVVLSYVRLCYLSSCFLYWLAGYQIGWKKKVFTPLLTRHTPYLSFFFFFFLFRACSSSSLQT